MDLVDMALPKRPKKKSDEAYGFDQPEFPYGLQLRFEREQVKVLPALKTFQVGDRVLITGEATVSMVRQQELKDKEPDYVVEMQLEKVACEPIKKKPPEQMSPKEYRLAREGKIVK